MEAFPSTVAYITHSRFPHHRFDDRFLLHPLVDEVRDPRIPEDVWSDLFGDAGSLYNFV